MLTTNVEVKGACRDMIINSTQPLYGKVRAPPSKSYTHRAIVIAALNDKATIVNPLVSDATYAMRDAVIALGAEVTGEQEWKVKGFGDHIRSAGEINVRNSGTALRLATSLAALANDNGTTVITGDPSLKNRPNRGLVVALQELGAQVKGTGPNHKAPIQIFGKGITGGTIDIVGDESSQFISSLLLTCPKATSDTEINVSGKMVSRPYIDMTLDILNQAGVSINYSNDFRKFSIPAKQTFRSLGNYIIHGDYSQAAFFMVAASLLEADVIIQDLVEDKQGDRKIVNILEEMGADIQRYDGYVRVKGPAELSGIEVDLCDTPDLAPVIAVLGIFAKGKTRLYNMPQIRYKESDRIAVLKREFSKLGVRIEDKPDEMIVYNTDLPPTKSRTLNPRGDHGQPDHRLTMALALIGLKLGRTTVNCADSINISYPTYVQEMRQLGADMRYGN